MMPALTDDDGSLPPHPVTGSLNLKWLGTALVVAGVGATTLAVLLESPLWSSLGVFLTGTGFACLEFGRHGFRGANPLAVATTMLGIGGLADFVALLLRDTDLHDEFFLYASPPHIHAGLLIMFVGLIALWAGYQLASGERVGRWALPSVWCDAGSQVFVPICVSIYAVRLLADFLIPVASLGTPGALFMMAGPIGAFLLTKRGAETSDRTMTWIGIGIAIVEATRAAMFEILRMNILLPLAAATIGVAMGTRSMRAFRRLELLPIYGLLVIGIPYFGTFGNTRDTLGYGTERLTEIQTLSNDEDRGLVSVVSRLTTVNQVSEVVRLAEESGFRRGQTLEYLAWVWIPRFLWPNKPRIAKGQWFAAELGRGFFLPSGAFSNSINMTIPGELYLNFSWLGIVAGCALVGALLSLVWRAAEAWAPGANPWGSALGFFLLYCGAVVTIDLQIIVTMIAAYLVFLAAAGWTRATQARRIQPGSNPVRAR